MVRITKDEAVELRQRFKNPYIIRLAKNKSKRHHYYIASEPKFMGALAEIRNCDIKEIDHE